MRNKSLIMDNPPPPPDKQSSKKDESVTEVIIREFLIHNDVPDEKIDQAVEALWRWIKPLVAKKSVIEVEEISVEGDVCEKCNEGTMQKTGKEYLSLPPMAEYKCDKCGHKHLIRKQTCVYTEWPKKELDEADPKRCQYEQAVEKYFGIEIENKPQKILLTDRDLIDLLCAFDNLYRSKNEIVYDRFENPHHSLSPGIKIKLYVDGSWELAEETKLFTNGQVLGDGKQGKPVWSDTESGLGAQKPGEIEVKGDGGTWTVFPDDLQSPNA